MSKAAKWVRIGAVAAVVVVLILVIVLSSSTVKPSISEQVWDTRTTLGDAETATNHFILYTDLVCPYCAVLGQVLTQNADEFEQWVRDNKVLYEVRVTDYLFEGMGNEYSRPSAEATYCATREDRFWDYYHAAMNKMYEDYQSKGIGVSKTSEQMKNVPDDYFLKIGKSIGLSNDFEKCVKNHETVDEITEKTGKALKVTNGVPFMFYNGVGGGVDATDGWPEVKMYFREGLKK